MLNRLRQILRPKEISLHVSFIENLADILQPKTYGEIGIYQGETFLKIKAEKRFAVDISKSALSYVPEHDSIVKVLGTSRDLAEILKVTNLELDLLFIDANHASEAVYEDFTNLMNHVSRKGVVLFHDTFPGSREFSAPEFCGDAYAAVPKLSEKYRNWSFVTLPIHPGLTLATRNPMVPDWIL